MARNETLFNLSQEQMKNIEDFISDRTQTPDLDAVRSLLVISEALGIRLAKICEAKDKKIFALERKLEAVESKKARAIEAGEFSETGLDSVDVALALLHELQQMKVYRLNKAKFFAILYEMYASWLHSKRQRLFAERPCAGNWGPVFWRVNKKVPSLGTTVGYESFKRLAEQNPGVAAFCRNAARKYYDWKESDITNPILKSQAYTVAAAKKGVKEIDDCAVYSWKESQR